MAADGRGAGVRSAGLVLRPGADGAMLVPDVAYPRAFTLRIGRTDQSYVDLDDPLRLEFDYVQRLVDVLDSVAGSGKRLRVVHVGGAAMTLPRYVAATRPNSAQIVLEPDIELTAFVRRHLPLPTRSGIKVRGVDGRCGIAELRGGYTDLVIIDAFVGARVPADLTTAEFLADARRALSDHGVIMINITDRGPLGYEDGMQFCRDLPTRCGVVAIPHQVLYDRVEAGKPYVRWAFCKQERVLDEAIRRLGALQHA